MNQQKLKFRIGLFLLLAITLFVGSLFFFGLTSFFEKKTNFVSFFNESVRGLNKGSAVRFRGVEIGQVREIRLSLDDGTTLMGIPVIYEIDISRLQNKLGVPVDISLKEHYENAVRDGLTAKLESSSMVTGQLYIDLNFRPQSAKGEAPRILNGNLHYLPSVQSLLSDVTDQLLKIIGDISKINFPEISSNLNETIVTLDSVLESFESEKTAKNLNETLLSVQSFLGSGDVKGLIEDFGAAAGSVDELMTNLSTGKGALGEPLAATLKQMSDTATALDQISTNFTRILESNTGPVADLERTLAEIRDTATALQSLLEFLRRHPNALIFGKQTP